jgi:hypothetical protein
VVGGAVLVSLSFLQPGRAIKHLDLDLELSAK